MLERALAFFEMTFHFLIGLTVGMMMGSKEPMALGAMCCVVNLAIKIRLLRKS